MASIFNETEWKVIVEQSCAIEFDWYARDRVGMVAVFSSYGLGAIPNAAKPCRDSYNDLYELVHSLPEITEAILVYKGGGRFVDWLKYSRQGLFGYDYQDAHRVSPLGGYDLLTSPVCPIHIDSLRLPPRLIRIIPVVDVDFGEEPRILRGHIPN
jgi:hypothetical protein